MAKLYEVRHPYYCEAGYDDANLTYEYWDAFLEEFGDSDPDLNLVVRWDWYEAEDEIPEHLFLAILLQRKARLLTCQINVSKDDEPWIKDWLEERSKTITAIWQPFLLYG